MPLKSILNVVIAGGVFLLLMYIDSLLGIISNRGYNRATLFFVLIEMLAPVSIIVFAIALKEKNNISVLIDEPADSEPI